MRTPFKDYLSQGKSNNYLDSEASGKLKAGEAAIVLTKKFKTKIYAKELHVFSSEWHHAGLFKKGNGKSTGRHVYFLTPTEVDGIRLETILENRARAEEAALTAGEPVQGWYVEFVRAPSQKGKKRWLPLLGLYKGPKGEASKTFAPLSDEAYADAARFQGKQLKPYAKHYSEVIEGREAGKPRAGHKTGEEAASPASRPAAQRPKVPYSGPAKPLRPR